MTPDEQDRLLPEQRARVKIDGMLAAAGWVVQDYKAVNLYAGTRVAVRELVTNAGPADYVLFVNRQAVGVVEAKKKGTTLSGVEWQTVKYQANLPDALPAYLLNGRLPYGYESTGDEAWFTCRMDPEPTARRVFWFNEPETLMWQIEDHIEHAGGTLRARIPAMPELEHDPARLRDAQFTAITNLERSLKDNHSRALIQMATGSGKTLAAANICERLIRHTQAKRILFLVDRAKLAKQTRRSSRDSRYRAPAESSPSLTMCSTYPQQGRPGEQRVERRSVLAAAFSGKLVPQDPGEEPASVLLERIRDRAAPTPTRGTRAQGSR